MNISQIRCQGCDKVFNPRGLSQHLSKPQNAACHAAQTVFQMPSVFQTTGEGPMSNSRSHDWDMDLANELNGVYYVAFERISLIRFSQMKSRISVKSPTVLNSTPLKVPTVHMLATTLLPPTQTMLTLQTLIYWNYW